MLVIEITASCVTFIILLCAHCNLSRNCNKFMSARLLQFCKNSIVYTVYTIQTVYIQLFQERLSHERVKADVARPKPSILCTCRVSLLLADKVCDSSARLTNHEYMYMYIVPRVVTKCRLLVKFASWILVGDQLGYAIQSFDIQTTSNCLNEKVWNKRLTILSIGATIMRKKIQINLCFEHLFSMFSFRVHLYYMYIRHLVNVKLGSPAFRVL